MPHLYQSHAPPVPKSCPTCTKVVHLCEGAGSKQQTFVGAGNVAELEHFQAVIIPLLKHGVIIVISDMVLSSSSVTWCYHYH